MLTSSIKVCPIVLIGKLCLPYKEMNLTIKMKIKLINTYHNARYVLHVCMCVCMHVCMYVYGNNDDDKIVVRDFDVF